MSFWPYRVGRNGHHGPPSNDARTRLDRTPALPSATAFTIFSPQSATIQPPQAGVNCMITILFGLTTTLFVSAAVSLLSGFMLARVADVEL